MQETAAKTAENTSGQPEKKKLKAVITDMQRYSVHDGPGIRTMVFFKGCPLRCQWCHNPETNEPKPELMYNQELCIGCGACIEACPNGAVSFKNGKIATDPGKCTLSGKCADVCYSGARTITGKYYTVEEVLDYVMRDIDFYRRTGGGVTLSGGEVLMHADFAAELLRRVKEQGVNTCIETCGFAAWEQAKKVIGQTDLVLFDIKHSREAEHIRFTGRSNRLILDNLHHISDMGKSIIARVPLIPGVNNTPEILSEIAEIAVSVHAKELHILPFHQIGTSKWDATNKDYLFRDVPEPTTEEVEMLVKKIGDIGIPIVIGGN